MFIFCFTFYKIPFIVQWLDLVGLLYVGLRLLRVLRFYQSSIHSLRQSEKKKKKKSCQGLDVSKDYKVI